MEIPILIAFILNGIYTFVSIGKQNSYSFSSRKEHGIPVASIQLSPTCRKFSAGGAEI
jgi:putative flippase GtrA